MDAALHSVIEETARLLVEDGPAICLTGAGISVPSGIPDFRSDNGLWARMDPMEYATIDAFRANPGKVWKLFTEIDKLVENARPNPAHSALARMEALGVMGPIITQNVDGLHQDAGSREVLEFHGSGRTLTCLVCGWKGTRERVKDRGIPPNCTCGAVLKPDVVLFGESIPLGAIARSMVVAERARVIIVAGSSASIAPASQIPGVVRKHGGRIIEMNLRETMLTGMADLQIRADLTESLPALAQAVEDLLKVGASRAQS